MFFIDHQSKEAIFVQLRKQVLEFIAIGILRKNDRLPSVRSLAHSLGINPNTVSKTYEMLAKEGIIYGEQGRGYFVSGEDSKTIIERELLVDFKNKVREMKRYQISQNKLYEVIEKIYKEDESND